MIKKWHLKAIVQKAISFLPARDRVNYWFQKHITRGVALTDEYFGYKIEHAGDHLRYFRKYKNDDLSNCQLLELGTGWYPVVPIAAYLSGLREVRSLDLTDWLRAENIRTTIRKFAEWRKDGRLDQHLPQIVPQRWEKLLAAASAEVERDELCQIIRLKHQVGDARHTGLPNDSVDLICSNNTFEHIPAPILEGILREFQRVLSPGGVMSHFIDLSDHFAHFDKSITIFNYLRYSEAAWGRIDNSIQPQNRLRWSDYKAMYQRLNLPISEESVRQGDREELASVPLAECFREYDTEDLLITHGYLVSS